jgi:hypothetical protein
MAYLLRRGGLLFLFLEKRRMTMATFLLPQ